MNMYSVRDAQTGHFNVPFFQTDDVQAIRMMALAATDKDQSFVARFPQHFDLYRLGEFDQRTGDFSGDGAKFVVNVKQASSPHAVEEYMKSQEEMLISQYERPNHGE